MEDYHFHLLWAVLISYVVFVFVVKAVVHLWWAPRRVENFFMKQGIKGPKYQLFLGNLKELASLNMLASAQSMPPLSHNILPRVLSFYHHWKKIYGNLHFFPFSFSFFFHTHTKFLFVGIYFMPQIYFFGWAWIDFLFSSSSFNYFFNKKKKEELLG